MPKSPPEGQKNVVIRVPDNLHAQMVDFAQANDLTISQLVRHAVRRYMEKP